MATALTAALCSHDRYFSRIIDMIPADLYKHTVSEDADDAVETKYVQVCKYWELGFFLCR
jgi:hypothetical protein